MRIFRQQKVMEWAPFCDRIAVELRKRVPATVPTPSVAIETAPGELIDKIPILEIKSERIPDGDKVRNVLTADLRSVNEALWHIEDEIRLCERAGDFGPRFVELARSVYHKNDERAAIKRRINVLLGSKIIEEKSDSSDLAVAACA